MWNIGFIQYPYLGSLLIDTPQNSEVYNALIKKIWKSIFQRKRK
jgi:hypothetical protein